MNCSRSTLIEAFCKAKGIFKKELSSPIDATDMCAVCTGSLTETPLVGCSCGSYPIELRCGHRFHAACITHPAQGNCITKCPLCRWNYNDI